MQGPPLYTPLTSMVCAQMDKANNTTEDSRDSRTVTRTVTTRDTVVTWNHKASLGHGQGHRRSDVTNAHRLCKVEPM